MKIESMLGGTRVGPACPVRIMGVINASPESFYKGSVPRNERALARTAERMERDGADFIDVGAMSTAPYLKTQISEESEARRLAWAVRIVKKNSSLPISIDSYRSRPASAGLEAGGSIVNDVTGLHGDPEMARVAKHARGLIVMAHPKGGAGSAFSRGGIFAVRKILERSLRMARLHKIPTSRIAVDPGIGFFRDERMPWMEWDLNVLRGLGELESLRLPVLIGVSRKSFIGKITGAKTPKDRLAGSLAAAAAAVLNGASIVRTHDVKETREAALVAAEIRSARTDAR